jgi:SNF2 family DNA or RNA helicase
LIIFYNFTDELEKLLKLTDRPVSIINGNTKDLTAYNNREDSITFVQYQAGGMGLNLQKSNRIVYYSPPLQWELYEQSKARIRRIGQGRSCFYYYLTCKKSIEEKIYETLKLRKSFDQTLFEKEYPE